MFFLTQAPFHWQHPLKLTLNNNKQQVMLIDHPFIPLPLKQKKRPVIISQQRPLIVVTNPRFSLLTRTIEAVLQQYGYAYQLQEAEDQQLMSRTLPIICFQEIILEREALVEFLAEICLSECGILQFVDRKQNMKRLYRQWWKILSNEFNLAPDCFGAQDLRRNAHINQIFQQMINFAMQVVGKGYQRHFRTFKSDRFNIESVFLTDVTQTILQQLPRLQSDFVLRGYFSKQIDFCNAYRELLQRQALRVQIQRKVVLVDQQNASVKEFPICSYNFKWFGGIFTVMAVAFLKWGK